MILAMLSIETTYHTQLLREKGSGHEKKLVNPLVINVET